MGQAITDPTSGSSFDFDFDPDPELDNYSDSQSPKKLNLTLDWDLYDWCMMTVQNLFSSSDKIHKVLHEVLLPWAGCPAAVVVLAPNEVDDRGEAGAADDVQVHGQVKVPGPHQQPQQVPQHIQAPGQQVIGDWDNIPLPPATN